MFVHKILHKFPIEIREMCERPGSKYASLTLAGNCGNYSVHFMFDSSLSPHADQKYFMT